MPYQGLSLTWHRRARHALAHSLRVRLVALFVLLALAMAAVFVVGMQYALSIGWRDAARPLVMDYVDKLAAEIGNPPSVERAQALVERLPLRVTINGPVVNWRSQPQQAEHGPRWRDSSRWDQEEHLLERKTADGHRIQFALSSAAWNDRPRFIGWATLALLLLFTAMAYRRVRRLLRPLDDIRAGALHCESVDLKALVQEVADSLGRPVHMEVAPGLPLLQLDPARIRLLLRNLLDNALRHSADASQPPMLRLHASASGGVDFSVRDFGAGVPPDQLPQLAHAFYRPDAARARDDGGVGLGLYLCKLVALAHGGTFSIANANPGLVITVTLPAPQSQ